MTNPTPELFPSSDPAPAPDPRPVPLHVSEQPPSAGESVFLVLTVVALGIIAFRHRGWLMRKVDDGRHLVEEFQKHGGVEELAKIARQAAEFLRPDPANE